jgi:hemerythrin-like domain-containing protein
MKDSSRRAFVISGLAGAGVVLLGCTHEAGNAGGAGAGAAAAGVANRQRRNAVSPTEDLMREHGLLSRVLLVYDEVARRVAAGEPIPVDALNASADIVRSFVEDYHAELEEKELFPRFRAMPKLAGLTEVLKAQHDAGRRLTDSLKRQARPDGDRAQIQRDIAAFGGMYRPHAAREDTVLFPALHALLDEKAMDRLGDVFEDRERELFPQGFDGVVVRVSQIEQSLGIDELSRFTPPVSPPPERR